MEGLFGEIEGTGFQVIEPDLAGLLRARVLWI